MPHNEWDNWSRWSDGCDLPDGSGPSNFESDPELMEARLVIGGANQALTNLMRTHSRFKLVYEDAVAAVFVASTDGVLSN